MAAYLAAVGSDPRAVQQRRPPGTGRGTATEATSRGTTSPATSDRGKQPETQAATAAGNGRRTPAAPEQAQSAPGAPPEAAPSQAAAAAPTRPQPLEEFEE
jgi:hypothetical protein